MTDAAVPLARQPGADAKLPPRAARGYWRTVGRRLRYDYVTIFFMAVIAFVALAAIAAPLVAPSIPTRPTCSIA